MWGNQQVGQREVVTCEISLVSQEARKFGEHGDSLRHRLLDRLLIWLKSHQPRSDHAMEDDDAADALKEIPVVDVHHLIHSRGALWIGRREFRLGPGAI